MTEQSTTAQLALDTPLAESTLSDSEAMALIEALLLVSPEPPTIDELAEVSGVPASRIESLVSAFSRECGRGVIVQRHGAQLHLATAPRFAAQISRYLGLDRESKLSGAALETLAIIAWRQPITRSEVEAIRGVDCAGVIATLHGRELIEPVGRARSAGSPYQYGTTIGFLKVFGLASLDDLPSLGSVNGQDAAELLRAVAPLDLPDSAQSAAPVT